MTVTQDSPSDKTGGKMSSRCAEDLAILEEQIQAPQVTIRYLSLYRYASGWDIVLIAIGLLFSVAGGSSGPLLTLLIGTLANSFRSQTIGEISATQGLHDVAKYSAYFIYIGIACFFCVAIGMATFSAASERIARRTREEYVAALFRQNIGYFDKVGAGEAASRASTDVALIQDGIGEKVSLVVQGLGGFACAIVIAFAESPKLAGIVMTSIVAMVVSIGGLSKFVVKYKSKSLEWQGAADNVAEEAISSIRNITAFGAQEKVANRYDGLLEQAEKWSTRNRSAAGFLMGAVLFMIAAEHALAFWQGSRFLVWGDISVRAVIAVQLAVMIGGANLMMALPHLHAFGSAVAAGSKVFAVINRRSPIDSQAQTGTTLDHVEGEIEFRDVAFAYPSRPDVTVFEGLNLKLAAGKTTAIAGPSGSGKSTVVGLIERFYKPIAGSVSVDGHELSALNLRWWRRQVALVSQEPVLFSGSIFENIEYGLIGSEHEKISRESKLDLVIEAAKTANAHDFITALPSGYDTQVGDAGRLMSGGQKQRIAIARAVVSNPKILLLDEATSNLDAASEAAVQAAVEKAACGRTTMIIAHKLSMVHHADKIVVVSGGRIVEQGSHAELAARGGVYTEILRAQNLAGGASHDREKADPVDDLEEVLSEKVFSGEKRDFTRVVSLSEKETEHQHVQECQKLPLVDLIRFMWSLNKPDKYSMLLGSLFSVLNGGNQPVRGILFAHLILALSYPLSESGKIRSQSNFWAGMFFILAVVQLLACTFQGFFFARSSARLIRRAQYKAFRSIIAQDIAFFDRSENSAGSLTSLLSSDANHLTGISGATIGAIIVFLTTVFGAIIIALSFGWKLTLVGMSLMPLLISCGFIRFWVVAKFDERTKETTRASTFVSQAVASIRTVASLTMEIEVLSKYRTILTVEARSRVPFIIKSAVAYAFSQSFMFLACALGFWYGGKLVANGEYDILRFFICFTETMFGAQAAGSILSFAPEIGTGRGAAESYKRLIEAPGVDLRSGEKVDDAQGSLEFRDVTFRYPERPAVVLRGLNLAARAGQFTAIVGQSGSGKSTTMALIERFYEPTTGSIMLDGRDISKLSLGEYRGQLALVSQETTLYDGTIKENLLFDRNDADDVALAEACKSANIYDFIMSLPDGFNTIVGPRASSLSGGERQRLAIARALLREPKILLLDEATSALDSTSEEVVEKALNKASQGRTTIAIAHRLSSIQHADVIYVLDDGRVVEKGTHAELLALRGTYLKMARLQSLEKD